MDDIVCMTVGQLFLAGIICSIIGGLIFWALVFVAVAEITDRKDARKRDAEVARLRAKGL